jgi:hypothetical protein
VSAGHPEGLPDLFLDRSLGRRQVPALLRDAGLRLHTLAEVYGVPADEAVADTDWLELAGHRGWPVLMKDERIRYRPSERAAVVAHRVQAFCLTGGNLRAAAMAEQYLAVIDHLAEACLSPGPFLYAVSARGLRRLDL